MSIATPFCPSLCPCPCTPKDAHCQHSRPCYLQPGVISDEEETKLVVEHRNTNNHYTLRPEIPVTAINVAELSPSPIPRTYKPRDRKIKPYPDICTTTITTSGITTMIEPALELEEDDDANLIKSYYGKRLLV